MCRESIIPAKVLCGASTVVLGCWRCTLEDTVGYRCYRRVEGAVGTDWGVCTSPGLEFDATVRLEHDGCDAFLEAKPGGAVHLTEPRSVILSVARRY